MSPTAADLLSILERFQAQATPVGKWRTLTPAFRASAPAIGNAFGVQGEQYRALLATMNLSPDDPGAWLAAWERIAASTTQVLAAPVQSAVGVGLLAGANALGQELAIDVAFNLSNPRAVAYLEAHGADLVAELNQTTKDRIKWLVTDGARQGQSYTEIANRISAEFIDYGRNNIIDILIGNQKWSRAEIIAVTELGNAYEAGNAAQAADLRAGGLQMEKKWLIADNRADPPCPENSSQGWIPDEIPFQSGHMQPLAHPMCRCTCLRRRVGAGQ